MHATMCQNTALENFRPHHIPRVEVACVKVLVVWGKIYCPMRPTFILPFAYNLNWNALPYQEEKRIVYFSFYTANALLRLLLKSSLLNCTFQCFDRAKRPETFKQL